MQTIIVKKKKNLVFTSKLQLRMLGWAPSRSRKNRTPGTCGRTQRDADRGRVYFSANINQSGPQ